MLPDLNAGCKDWGHDSRHLCDPGHPGPSGEMTQKTDAQKPKLNKSLSIAGASATLPGCLLLPDDRETTPKAGVENPATPAHLGSLSSCMAGWQAGRQAGRLASQEKEAQTPCPDTGLQASWPSCKPLTPGPRPKAGVENLGTPAHLGSLRRCLAG